MPLLLRGRADDGLPREALLISPNMLFAMMMMTGAAYALAKVLLLLLRRADACYILPLCQRVIGAVANFPPTRPLECPYRSAKHCQATSSRRLRARADGPEAVPKAPRCRAGRRGAARLRQHFEASASTAHEAAALRSIRD